MNLGRHQQIILSLVAGGLFLAGLLLWLSGTPSVARADPGDLFVTPDGSGGACAQDNPGALQTALGLANDGDTLYLAEGTYTGTGGAVITLTKSITLYGGWDGSPTGPAVRDPEAYPTILDGEGQRRVMFLDGRVDRITPTIGGLIIAHGNAAHAPYNSGRGGGILGTGATPYIANTIITDNVAGPSEVDGRGYGGGIFLINSPGQAVITGNRVLSNVANPGGHGEGGGIFLDKMSGTQVVNNLILGNTAAITDGELGRGGGIAVTYSEGATLTGNQVEHNVANARGLGYGGGVYVNGPQAVMLTGNVVLSNTASLTGGLGRGGGIAIYTSGGAIITGNRVEHNVAQGGPAPIWGSDGGGIYCYSSDGVTIGDNLIRYNIASIPANGSGGGIMSWGCDHLSIIGNTIQDNFGSTGGNGYGGGLDVYGSQGLLVEANRITGNTATTTPWGWGGGLHMCRDVFFTMTNNIVAANRASYKGGGMAFETGTGSDPVTGTLAHNTFAANDRGSGEGRIAIHLNDSRVTLVLTNNLIYSHTYGVYATAGSTATLYRTLFYAHSEADTGGPGTITNTDPITGQNPLLTADYHLGDDSPAIDAGLSLPWLTADIDGDPRPIGPAPDVGADEWRCGVYLPLVVGDFP